MPFPVRTASSPIAHSGAVSRDSAWLARDQNDFLAMALRKLNYLKDAFEENPICLEKLLELERILEDMERVNQATLTAFRATQIHLVNPAEVIHSTVELVRALDDHSVQIDASDMPKNMLVPIFETHLQQVIFNILRSTLRFVPSQGGCISVVACLRSQERTNPALGRGPRRALHVSVEDNGDLTPNLRRSLFRNADTRKFNDSTLSLGHALKLLGLYGGTLRFERRDGPGTRMHIVWPF